VFGPRTLKKPSLFLCSTQLHILFKNRLTLSSYLIECERLNAKVEVQDAQLLKQHYHELIESKNEEFRENGKEQERLRKELRVTPDACIDRVRSSRT
jgi:hypothetical protein